MSLTSIDNDMVCLLFFDINSSIKMTPKFYILCKYTHALIASLNR